MATRQTQKAAAIRENRDRRPYAVAKYIRIAPSKVHVVLDIIRGKDYNEAAALLEATPNAAANAEVNKGMNRDNLYVAECYADMGPTLKRVQPVSKGRAYRILKRTSHITVILDERKA